MSQDFQNLELPYQRSPEDEGDAVARHPVIVVGAGPVGLSCAIVLAQRGIPVVLLDDDFRLSIGSRAICFAKRTLEIWDRLGVGQRMVDKGVSWQVGRVYFRDQQVYSFDLLAESGHHRPAFINLQQYYVEGFLYERALQLPNIDLRFKHEVVGVQQDDGGVQLTVRTPGGSHTLQSEWLIACDGSRSPCRKALGLTTEGRSFRDRFLIADIRMPADYPPERRFWFDPPFHPGQSVLLHRQPDGIWRVDFQLGWDADPELEKRPERVLPRLRAMLGDDMHFELVWCSVYTFACQRMARFRHGRVLFAGDSAHGVSPFGARGANSGVQDADNLAWKLALVLQGKAPDALLDSYACEREQAADENILNSTRATDFITPKSQISQVFRDAVLSLARRHAFARRLVNSGRLSVPTVHADSPLNTLDVDVFGGVLTLGASAVDVPLKFHGRDDWLLPQLGPGFTLVCFASVDTARIEQIKTAAPVPVQVVRIESIATTANAMIDSQGLFASRHDASPGACYLFRPDQHLCARWRRLDAAAVLVAIARATGAESTEPTP
jgi:3-(3-hydroxy-phenyl)propionate hydroxylase